MKKKNIIVFMADQLNADTVTKPGRKAITPNLDAFRCDATQFDQAYTVAPHCCPSRVAFFSSLYPSQSGVWNNVEVDNALSRGLYDGVTLLPEKLQEAGYTTVFSGKWHVSAYEGPTDRGFDYNLHEYISNYGRFKPENRPRVNDWEQVYTDRDTIKLDDSKEFGEIVRKGYPKYHHFGIDNDPFGDTKTVKEACSFLDGLPQDNPFFLYVGTTGPHDPYAPPQAFLDLYKDVAITLPDNFYDSMMDKPVLYRRTREQFTLTEAEHIEGIRRYLAFASFEDALFGELINKLKEKGLYEDSIIIFLSDHGDYVAAHGLWAKGLPCFREAYQIPLLMKVPGVRGGGKIDGLASITDVGPTILDLVGLEPFAQGGDSLLPLLQDKEVPWRTELFSQTNGNEVYGIQRAVWNRSWKYVLNTFDYDELYDLQKDPGELHNLAKQPEMQPIIKEMCKKLWAFAKEHDDNCTCPYIMVGLAPYGPGILLE